MTDDDLRAQLRGADPAASLAPLPSDRRNDLVARAMADAPAQVGRPGARRPGRPWLLAAAAATLAAAAGIAVGLPAPGPDIRVGPSASPVVRAPIVSRITADGSGARSKCETPSVAELRSQDLAVEGTVRAISGTVATVDVIRVWRGPQADVVEITADSGTSEDVPRFEAGATYLIASRDGRMHECGLTGRAGPELLSLYDEAF